MDFSDSTRVIYNRIRKLEPENATKIIGYLFLHDHGEHEMIRLAFSPDSAIQSLIVKAKADLGLSDNPNGLGSVPSQYSYLNGVYSGSSYCPKPMVASAPELPVKVCHYFVKGFCKHGSNCRYFHGQCSPVAESFPPQFNTGSGEDHGPLSNGSLEKLEMEITELLKSRGGSPVSIATLPMLYYEKYGYSLQADGYLTESQRHGKAGFSLSKLLSRLKNSIHLIDRPHGQHSVILAKDAYKYLDHDRSDSGGIVSGSRQIYLTFPAESGFTEQDVSNYFNKFGPVQDVRIPGQQKRMFGFVTFIFPETAKQILSKGNPHFICGSRVLVKPYKDKSRLPDRKCTDKMQNNAIHNPQVLLEGESDVQSMPRYSSDISRVHGNEPVDDQELQFDFERMHLGEFQLAPSSLAYRRYIPFSNQSRLSKVRAQSSPDRPGYFFDAVNNGSNGKDQLLHLGSNCSDQDSGQGINLPESPFASIIV